MSASLPPDRASRGGAIETDAALRALPAAYAVALRLYRAGADERLIARALDVELDAVPALLELATAKLDRLLRGDPVT
jgi:DNA-directed RNA polymerase specialized sigma24 family protein